MKIYRCCKCGNILTTINDANVIPECCNEKMEILMANTTDGSFEKHVPMVKCDNNTITVRVGEKEHPMIEDHYIKVIILKTDKGHYLKFLKPNEKPEAIFTINDDEKLTAVYEYCTIHSLFKKDIACEKE